jgi:hypothetical protein
MSENKIVFPRNIWADPEHPPAICGKDILTKLIPGASRSVTMISLSYLSVFTDFEACSEFLFSMDTLEQWLKLQGAKEYINDLEMPAVQYSAPMVEGKACCLFDRPWIVTVTYKALHIKPYQEYKWRFNGYYFRLFDKPTNVIYAPNISSIYKTTELEWRAPDSSYHREGDKPAWMQLVDLPGCISLQVKWVDRKGKPKRADNQPATFTYKQEKDKPPELYWGEPKSSALLDPWQLFNQWIRPNIPDDWVRCLCRWALRD